MKPKKQNYDKKMMKLKEYFKEMIASTITSFMDQINISKYSLDQKDYLNLQESTTLVLDNRRGTPLDGGHSKKLMARGL